MRKTQSYLLALLLANIFTIAATAQTSTITGRVENSTTKESVAAVTITLKGTNNGTYTDDKGNFKLDVPTLPVTLLISSIGYEMQEITVTNATEKLMVSFKPGNTLGQEVVVSATKTSQKILESPVSIERISSAAIRNSPAATYYDVIGNLKGVDIVSSSLTFKTPTTRGFSGSGNLRVNQIVDGMDNQAPGLNFSVGSFIGLSELDVDNVELLPGASSALYGPGGMNGTILVSSKNPFKYQGISVQVKEGVMNTGHQFRQASNYVNGAIRIAKKLSDKFAFKIGAEVIAAKDWLGYDKRNYLRNGIYGSPINGDRATDANYDGINTYGDETTADFRPLIRGIAAQKAPFLVPFIDQLENGQPLRVSRTGYAENEVVNNNTINIKLSGALHYKISSGTEAIIAGYWGTGNTVYTGSDRYSLRNLKMGQYKIELNNKNWMIRAYTTQEDAGESYNATVTTQLLNESWKKTLTFNRDGTPNPQETDWLVQYGLAYLTARLNGLNAINAQSLARANADNGRLSAGSSRFNQVLDSIRSIPIHGSTGGGKFVDRTNLYQVEGQYNLSDYTGSFADVLVGANYKRYLLNSEGTLFADSAGKIGINEIGAYVQATKKLLNDVLKLTVSGRYDKNENFAGRFTPRFTALVKVAENSNIRVSYQTAYRFPSTQQQWIDLGVGSYRLVGGNNYFENKYKFIATPTNYYDNGVIGESYTHKDFKPESVSTVELGYKGLLAQSKLLVDVYGYYGQYQDFITRRLIIQPGTRAIYSIPVNTTSKVKTYGFGLSLDYKLPYNFQVGANISSDNLTDVPSGFKTYFSTPKYRTNLTVGNAGFGYKKRLGFNVTYKWQDAFYYESDFANGNINAIHTLDAQVSLRLPAAKSVIKLGANNLLNQYYTNGVGNAIIGGLYYVSFGYNIF